MASIDLLNSARQAQLNGDLATAEANYRTILKTTDATSSDDADKAVSSAAWNLALILRDQRSAYAEAADVLAPTRRTRAGALKNDPELHVFYGQLRFKEFETRQASFDVGPSLPVFVGAQNAINYTPAPLAALSEGVRAYVTALKQSAGSPQLADYARQAQAAIAYGTTAYKAFAGTVQEGAIGRIMTAARDRLVARGKIAANDPRATARFGITEGPVADTMAAKTTVLYQAAKTAMMDDGKYSSRWQQWLLAQIGAANALTTLQQ